MNFAIIMYGFSLGFLTFGTILPIIFLIIICINIRPLKSNVLQILISNTYLALIFSSITLIETSLTSFLGNIIPSTLPSTSLCQVRVYLMQVGLSSVVYSFILQALFRLFRIVFYQKKKLRSLRVFSIAVILKWLLAFLINLLYILLNDIEYVPKEYRCAIPWTNIRAAIMVILLTYTFPVNMIFLIYFYIIRYVRRATNAMHNRQNKNKRDIAVFKRIIYLFTVLQILSVPLCVVLILNLVTNATISWSYYIQAFSLSLNQILVSIVLASVTPQIQEKFKWNRSQVHPTVEVQARHRNIEDFGQPNHEERF